LPTSCHEAQQTLFSQLSDGSFVIQAIQPYAGWSLSHFGPKGKIMSICLQKSLLSFSIIICFLSLQGCDKNPAAPTTGTIQGRVLNTAGDTLIVSASVSTNPPTSDVSTDTQGKYVITGVSEGLYMVLASKTGYDPDSVAITIMTGQTTTADMHLERSKVAIPLAPCITTQPQSQTVVAGQSVTFSVTATGTAPLLYQWYKDSTAISGATSSSCTLSNIQTTGAGKYTVTVSNIALPNATSNGAVLTVKALVTVTDIDGNVYHTVTIGTQVWMVENLKTTKYNDGAAIPLVMDIVTWAALTTPGYCWNNNDAATYKDTYGVLYNWYTVNTGKLAPAGWHVPTDSEWSVLATYLGGDSVAGSKLKEVGTTHWISPNTGATNETGFTALPGGYRNLFGAFFSIGGSGYWWSATVRDATYSWGRGIYYNGANVFRFDYYNRSGFSVRCVRD
jgi:uncharacterized protein (TIGR02145 family)